MGNRNICKRCREPYSGTPVCPSSWGWMKKEAVSHCSPGSGGLLSECYCSEKCRAEAEGGNGGGGGESRSAREEEYESGGGSSSSGELPSGCVKIVGMILAFLVVCGILGMLFCKNEDANDPAVKMAKWEEHLEKRRAAFAEGLSEEGVEARGLKNFTWEEWQNRSKAKAVEKEEDISEKYRAHMNKRMSLLNGGLTDKVLHEMGYDDYTFEAFKQNYKNIKYKALEEVRQNEAEAKARAEAETQSKAESESERRADSLARKEAEAKARAEASARAKAEAENKRLAEKLARKEAEEKARAREQARAKMEAKAEAEARVRAEAEAKRLAEELVRKEAEEKDRAREEARAKIQAEAKAKSEADAKSNVSVGSEDSVSGQRDDDKHKPSKDSNGIRIVVQGKGKTQDAAVRWAIRDAVWKTVGKWVDSKARIQENHDKVVARVKTITEADVAKYELIDTQKLDGDYIVKVRVSVSKKKIAPKFAEIFPDVFGNE